MRRHIRLWTLLLTAAAVLAISTQPAFAAETHQPDGLIRISYHGIASEPADTGKWVGSNIYNTTAAHQKRFEQIAGALVPGEYTDFTVEVQNDGTRKDKFVIKSPGPAIVHGWKLTFQVPVPGCGDCRPPEYGENAWIRIHDTAAVSGALLNIRLCSNAISANNGKDVSRSPCRQVSLRKITVASAAMHQDGCRRVRSQALRVHMLTRLTDCGANVGDDNVTLIRGSAVWGEHRSDPLPHGYRVPSRCARRRSYCHLGRRSRELARLHPTAPHGAGAPATLGMARTASTMMACGFSVPVAAIWPTCYEDQRGQLVACAVSGGGAGAGGGMTTARSAMAPPIPERVRYASPSQAAPISRRSRKSVSDGNLTATPDTATPARAERTELSGVGAPIGAASETDRHRVVKSERPTGRHSRVRSQSANADRRDVRRLQMVLRGAGATTERGSSATDNRLSSRCRPRDEDRRQPAERRHRYCGRDIFLVRGRRCLGLVLGENSAGQLGDGTTTNRHRAVRVTLSGGGFLSNATVVSVFSTYTQDPYIGYACAATKNGARVLLGFQLWGITW